MTDEERQRLVIASHHPDRLRRPAAPLGALGDETFQQVLAWNVFRTLELVSPSFWLRRLHLRLTGDPSVVAPQIARVHLWHHLPLPPIQRIDGHRPDVVVDVLIETEHAVWALVADSPARNVMDGDAMAAVVDAGSWFAGPRPLFCGVIESATGNASPGAVLHDRYSRSRDSARLQSATRGPSTPARAQWGALAWSGMAALLQDCCESANLPSVERALARNALEWLTRVGFNH